MVNGEREKLERNHNNNCNKFQQGAYQQHHQQQQHHHYFVHHYRFKKNYINLYAIINYLDKCIILKCKNK